MEGSHKQFIVFESWTCMDVWCCKVAWSYLHRLRDLVTDDTLLFWGSRIGRFCRLQNNLDASTGNNETAFVFGQAEPFVGGTGLGRRLLRRPPAWPGLLPHRPAGVKTGC